MLLLIISNHLPFLSAGAKAFVCDQCGAQFSKEDALETHRQTHTGELALVPVRRDLHSVTVHGCQVPGWRPLSVKWYPAISWRSCACGGLCRVQALLLPGQEFAGATLPLKNSHPGLGRDLCF